MPKNNPKIIVVEDDKFLLKAYNIKFKKAGFDIVTAADGIAGLELAEKEKPSLILLDLMLPKLNGFDFLKRLRENEKIKDVPVIVLSNLGQTNDRQKALELGAKEYFIKTDYSLEEIIEKIKQYIS